MCECVFVCEVSNVFIRVVVVWENSVFKCPMLWLRRSDVFTVVTEIGEVGIVVVVSSMRER